MIKALYDFLIDKIDLPFYPCAMPQGVDASGIEYPAVVYSLISDEPDNILRSTYSTRIQLDIHSPEHSAVNEIVNEFFIMLNGYSGNFGEYFTPKMTISDTENPSTYQDDAGTWIYTRSIDLLFRHNMPE